MADRSAASSVGDDDEDDRNVYDSPEPLDNDNNEDKLRSAQDVCTPAKKRNQWTDMDARPSKEPSPAAPPVPTSNKRTADELEEDAPWTMDEVRFVGLIGQMMATAPKDLEKDLAQVLLPGRSLEAIEASRQDARVAEVAESQRHREMELLMRDQRVYQARQLVARLEAAGASRPNVVRISPNRTTKP